MMLILLFTGCGGNEKNILLVTGKVPPTFFHFSSKNSMDAFLLDTTKFSVLMPETKAYDFQNGRRWNGYSDRDGHSIVIDGMAGHILISTSYKADSYTEWDRAIEFKDYKYLKSTIKYGKDKYGREGNINVHYETHGKENYSCMVKESRDDRYGKHKIGYHCYKFNPSRTLAKNVTVVLTYNKPTNTTLAKQYTYADLQNRAKRMLDSLYIKDGW